MFEDSLPKDTSDEADLSWITLKFVLATEPRGDATAEERQASDAVARATDAMNLFGSTPTAARLLDSAVDKGTNVITKVKTFENTNTWGILLQRIELFDKIVSDISQVFGPSCLGILKI